MRPREAPRDLRIESLASTCGCWCGSPLCGRRITVCNLIRTPPLGQNVLHVHGRAPPIIEKHHYNRIKLCLPIYYLKYSENYSVRTASVLALMPQTSCRGVTRMHRMKSSKKQKRCDCINGKSPILFATNYCLLNSLAAFPSCVARTSCCRSSPGQGPSGRQPGPSSRPCA